MATARTVAILLALPPGMAAVLSRLPATTSAWAIGLLILGYAVVVAGACTTSKWPMPVKLGVATAHVFLSVPVVAVLVLIRMCPKSVCG